jgi:hypothetical protein
MRMRKPPRALGPNEPFRHPDHPRPSTRRQFVAQGFLTGAATILGPSLLGLMADPRIARASSNLAPDIQAAVAACGITTGAGKIPFICFDLAGGGNIAGSNVLVGGPKGQLDFLSVAGYSKLGLPGTMVPNASAAGSNVDSTLGLRFHIDSAHLRGIKTRAKSALVATNTAGTIIPALSQNDTNVNPHNPMYGIYQYGARGGLLDLIGSVSSMSGGSSMAPPTMVIPSATPVKISSSQDSKGLVNTGQLGTLFQGPSGPSDITNVMESMKRISDAKYGVVQAYTDSTANAAALKTQTCGYTKAAYVVDTYGNPASVNPDLDTLIVGSTGIFSTAEYQSNSDFQKTAAVMKLVIDGNAAAGTIEMGGFDYHSGNRMDGEAKDENVGNCIGACLQYAALTHKPLMIYVFSDGSLASSGMIDNSVGGRGKGVWTGDNQNTAATYFLVYNPNGKPMPAQSNPEMSLQLGYYNSDGGLNTTGSPAGNNVFNLAQMVVLNYMALHGDQAKFPTLYPAPNLNNTLGTGTALDALIAYAPIVNGKIGG